MQNTPIPASLNAAPVSTGTTAPARQGATNGDGPSFSQALTSMVAQRQIEQRRQDSAAGAANRPVAAAQLPANAPAPAAFVHGAPTPPQQPQSTPQPSKAPQPASAAPADGAQASAAAAEAAGTAQGSPGASTKEDEPATPVADLIALVASFNQPAEATGTAAAGASAAAPASDAGAAAADAAPAALAAPVADTSAQLAVAGAAPALALQPASAAPARPAGTAGLSATADGAARPAARTLAALPAGRSNPAAAAAGADSTVSNDAAAGATHPAGGASATPAATDQPAFADVLQGQARSQSAAADPAPLRAALASAHDSLPAGVNGPLAAPVQQAALAVAQAAGTPTDRLAARVGTPDWDAQLGQKIVWMAAGQDQSATLTLNPPDLGPVQVVLSVSNDQAQVTFSSAQPEVRQALENAMPKLRDMMSESGIALGNATVNDGSAGERQAGQAGQAGEGGQSRSRGQGQAGGQGRGDQGGGTEVPVRRGRMIGGAGVVDTFA